jgi:hypothetical protein
LAEANTIANLGEAVKRLQGVDRAVFERIFAVSEGEAKQHILPSMRKFCEENFGSVARVENQKVVKVTNKVTLETAMFNPLRGMRPAPKPEGDLEDLINVGRGEGNDLFHKPLEMTAEDIFGRVQGEFGITASNIAKADVWHGVVVFNEFHPLKFSQDQVIDYIMTAREWAEIVLQKDPQARYFVLMWNCLWRSASSIVHGHIQMMSGRDMHYGIIERLRRDADAYSLKNRRSYFNDLVIAHRSLGLSADPADRVKALVSLTPVREQEIILLTDDYSPELGEAIYKVLAFYKANSISSFNVTIQMPPLAPTPENWQDFPVMVRLVDRGNPLRKQSDIGSTELYVGSVIAGDPFKTAADFRDWLRKNS